MSNTQPTAPDEALAERWHQLMREYTSVTGALDRALGAHGLSASEFEVLEQLERVGDDGLRMADLADRVHLSQSALSRLIGRLERTALLHRQGSAADRRSVITTITAEGRIRYAAARPVHRAVLRAESTRCRLGLYLTDHR